MADWVFDFELEDDPDGEWIPLAVRMRLDLSGRKISLADWQALTPAAQHGLLAAPIATAADVAAFARLLDDELVNAGLERARPLGAEKLDGVSVWRDARAVPDAVATELAAVGSSTLWPRLDLFGRYVVEALARKRKRRDLAAAIAELGARGRVKS